MLRIPTIRAFGSIFLLVIFSFSITPKIAFHNLLAHHKDTHSTNRSEKDQLAKAGYHCDCDNLVVVLPFLDLPAYISKNVFSGFVAIQVRTENQIHFIVHHIFGLRGPPANSLFI